ncbi:MAG: arginase family protein [Thermaerobacterales bacterium]
MENIQHSDRTQVIEILESGRLPANRPGPKWPGAAPPEIDAFRAAGVYDALGSNLYFARPAVPDDLSDDPVLRLGQIGGAVAGAVANGLTRGCKVALTGGNCTVLPAVLGGFQAVFGPDVRLGLVWFDAHGDFNTPSTTLSGMLGGMPVAVSAGLCHSRWRLASRQRVPLPTDRIVMVDVRNLDPDEERLVRATDVSVAPAAGPQLAEAVEKLAAETDIIYLHIDHDILDETLVPTHGTKEPGGPDMAATIKAVETVMQTQKVGAFSLVSVYAEGEGSAVTVDSAIKLLKSSFALWR